MGLEVIEARKITCDVCGKTEEHVLDETKQTKTEFCKISCATDITLPSKAELNDDKALIWSSSCDKGYVLCKECYQGIINNIKFAKMHSGKKMYLRKGEKQ